MSWYWIVLIVLVANWVITTVLAQIDDEWALRWGMGLIYPVCWVITYPIRQGKKYEQYRDLYEKEGISKIEYIFGKRPRRRRR